MGRNLSFIVVAFLCGTWFLGSGTDVLAKEKPKLDLRASSWTDGKYVSCKSKVGPVDVVSTYQLAGLFGPSKGLVGGGGRLCTVKEPRRCVDVSAHFNTAEKNPKATQARHIEPLNTNNEFLSCNITGRVTVMNGCTSSKSEGESSGSCSEICVIQNDKSEVCGSGSVTIKRTEVIGSN